jgi:transposase
MARYELTEFEWKVIQPLLPNKPRGVPRVDDRRVLNGIFWVLRSGSPWADVPERYGPPTTIYNRFNRWRKAGVWDKLMDAIIAAHDGKVQMIDSSVVRVHQQAAAQKTSWRRLYRSKSWRADHQVAPAGNRQRPAGPDRAFAGVSRSHPLTG